MRSLLTTFAVLFFLTLCEQSIYAQEGEIDSIQKPSVKRFSASIKGGVSFANTTDGLTNYPLYAKNDGGMFTLELRYDLHPKNYVFVTIAHHFLQLDAQKAGRQLLSEDAYAQQVRLQSKGIGITQLGVGWGNRFCITGKIKIAVAPIVGVSLLHLPNMTAEIDTQPHTTLTYNSVTNLSFYFGAYAAVSYQLADDLFLELNLAYTQAKHDIKPTLDTNEARKTEAWSYQLLTTNAGLTYRLF